MITLTKNGNAIVFTFSDNAHYLFDGTIEVPVNSLTLITDNSQMATFKKSASNDVFISATYAELGMSKSELESWFKENACGSTGGGGVTSGEVETMIDASISGKANTSAVTAVDDALTAHTADTTVHVTSADKTAWNAKSDFSGSYNDLTDKPTIPTVPTSNTAFTNDAGYITSGEAATQIEAATSGKADTTAVTASIQTAVSGKADTTAFTAYSAATDARLAEDEEVTAAGLNALNDALGDKADTSAVTEAISSAVSGKADTSAVTASIATAVSGKQDTLIAGSGITISGNVISSEGGNKVVELTQAQYDALVDKDPDTFYIITDAEAIDINNYYTKTAVDNALANKADTATTYTKTEVDTALSNKADTSAVTEAISSAVSGKVETSAITSAITSASTNAEVAGAKAVYDAIQAGGGGGSSYTAGDGIDITNDVISVTGKVDTSAITTSITSASTNTQVSSAKAVYDQLGGLKLVKISQSDYDQLATKDPNTLYVIVD